MDEASGSVADCTSNGNNGTVSSATQNATGKYSKGIQFNGNNHNVNFGSAASLDDIAQKSVGGWIAPTSDGFDTSDSGRCEAGVILEKDQWGFCQRTVRKLRFYYRWNGGTYRWDTSSTVAGSWDGTFYHMAVTYDKALTANNPTFYVNGVAQTTSAVDGAPCCGDGNANSDASADLTAGYWVGGGIDEFQGIMDELFVYSGMLNSTDISDIMNNGLDGTQASTVRINYIRGSTIRGSKI